MAEPDGFREDAEPIENLTQLADLGLRAVEAADGFHPFMKVIILINDPLANDAGMGVHGCADNEDIADTLATAAEHMRRAR